MTKVLLCALALLACCGCGGKREAAENTQAPRDYDAMLLNAQRRSASRVNAMVNGSIVTEHSQHLDSSRVFVDGKHSWEVRYITSTDISIWCDETGVKRDTSVWRGHVVRRVR